MSGRTRSLGVARAALAALAALAGALIGACYDVPRPACGFTCGPASACPSGYACAADRICHRNGTPADLMCAPPDAAGPADAADAPAIDAPAVDAPAIDAPAIDAPAIDAPANTGPWPPALITRSSPMP